MIRYYFRDTFRNIWRYKTQSFIGIFLLAFGLASFVPALYWLRYEMSYDSFYANAEHIYRIYSVDKQTGKTNDLVSGILERKLNDHYAPIQSSTVFFIEQNDCSTQGMPHIRLRTLFTDSTFLHVFPQVIISGNARQPLQVTNNIVITETVAVRLFGDVKKAIGQQIKSTNLLIYDPPYTVTAVIKDPPSNTNLSFEAILSHEQIGLQKFFVEESGSEIWNFASLQMYVNLHPHTDIHHLSEQLGFFPLQSYSNPNIELRMLPISDIRHKLSPDVPFTLNFIRLLLIAGALLLFSALFNFLNLYLNLYYRRIREFRLRNINGALGAQLIQQMIFELTFAILLALLISSCFVVILSPVFSHLMAIPIRASELINLFVICAMGVLILLVLIGFILSWRLSGLAVRPLSVRDTNRKSGLQRLATTLQLAVSIVFIVSTLVVMLQMRFVNGKYLGFKRNNIIHLSGLVPFIEDNARVALMSELLSIPQIEKITDTGFTPQHSVNLFNITTNVEWPGKQQSEKPAFNFITTDSQFAETFGITLLKGEWLNELGTNKIVLNEEAARVMGLSNPVGTTIRMSLRNMEEYRVVGVVKDFHTLSLRSRIHPTIFLASPYPTNNFYIRATSGQEQEAIQRINDILPKLAQADASFIDVHPVPLDELYDRLNYSEQAGLKIFSVLAMVCLLISLFGIYAVASGATQVRRKEIAMRKVVGAKVNEIVVLFFYEYTMQVIKASALALPLAYFVMYRWLQGYAYRMSIPWWLLIGVTSGLIVAVLLTVLVQVLKAANNNPAKVVRSPS